MEPLVFTGENGRLKIDVEPLKIIRKYILDDFEAGGVLLGRRIINSIDIIDAIVDFASEPMQGDVRGKGSFKRSVKEHQNLINYHYENSKGTCNYLGEWHTHSSLIPEPSKQDMISFENIIKKTKGDFKDFGYFYFVIVGVKVIRVWEGDIKNYKIKEMKNNYFNKGG